jgi:hypothetical protein
VSQLDALRLVEEMRNRAVSLATAENYVRDPKVASRAEAIWSGPGTDGGLVSQVWIQGAFPSKQSDDCLASLAQEGLFPRDLVNYLDINRKFPADRLLFEHQSQSIRAARQNTSAGQTVNSGNCRNRCRQDRIIPATNPFRPLGSTQEERVFRNAVPHPLSDERSRDRSGDPPL